MDLPDELDLPESRWNRFQPSEEPELPDPWWNRFQAPKPESPWPRRLAAVLSIVLVMPLAYAASATGPRSSRSMSSESCLASRRRRATRGQPRPPTCCHVELTVRGSSTVRFSIRSQLINPIPGHEEESNAQANRW